MARLRSDQRLTTISLLAALLSGVAVPRMGCGAEESRGRWEERIAAFRRQDERAPPPKRGLLFVGSSSIRRWDLARHFPARAAIRRGVDGAHVAQFVRNAEELVLRHEPRTVVLYAGENDLADGKTPRQVATDFRSFARAVHESLPKAKIIFISVKASRRAWILAGLARRTNGLVEEICRRDDRLIYVDVFTPMLGEDGHPREELFRQDGLHLSEEGYRLWTSLLQPHITAPASSVDSHRMRRRASAGVPG